MNILDFINNQSFEDNQDDSSSMTPLEAFHKECDELESLCPNLNIVRNHIKAFRFVYDENGSNVGVQPMLPDCEINYDLGYVYDPQFNKWEDDIFRDFINLSGACSDYEKKFEHYGITHLIIYEDSALDKVLRLDSNYKELYKDDNFIIYERLSAK